MIRDVGLPSFAGLSFIVWFGVISAASLLLSLLVARPANRRLEHAPRQTITRVLLFADVALIATVAVFGLAGSVLARARRHARDEHDPRARRPALLELAQPVDHRLERPRDVFSITGQADAIGQWTGGPAIGAIGNVFGIRAALVPGASLLSPAVALYARAVRRDGGLGQAVEASA